MPRNDALDLKGPPFDQLKTIQRLSKHRRGQGSIEHARHQLYVAHDRQTSASVLITLTSKPGLVYQNNLLNEIASLSTINRDLPDSPYFPVVKGHGRLPGGRVYLITSLFDELPLATTIGAEPMPAKMVACIRTAIEVAKALTQIHRLNIFHVDLNPMNILHRVEKGGPVIRIVDFESPYELARHATGVFYSPPTTPGYSAPEVTRQAPDGAQIFSLWAPYSTRCWLAIPERGELRLPLVSTVIRISTRISRRSCSRRLIRIPPRAMPRSRSFTQFWPPIWKKYGRDDRGRRPARFASPLSTFRASVVSFHARATRTS